MLAVAAACQGGSYFVCNDDDDCAGQGAEGVCQPTGACSFPDFDCPSGQRYGDASQPSLAGECVSAGEGEGTTGTPEDPSTSTGPGSSSNAMSGDVTGESCPPDWWDCAWAHRQQLSLARAVGETLIDVPVLVLLAAGRVDHERMQADGEDVRLVSASGTEVPYEIERWDPASVSAIWIGVDELGGAEADHVWLYYGNPVAENAEDPAGVWPEPFVGVWHLEGDPLDSTFHGHDATLVGDSAAAPGHIANGRDLLATTTRLDVGTSDSLTDLFAGGATFSAWFRARSFGGSGFGRIADKEDATANAGWLCYAAEGGRLVFRQWFGTDANVAWETADAAIELHRWIHLAITFDALGSEVPRIFVDGVEVELAEAPEVPVAAMFPSDLDVPLILGNRPTNDRRFDGILDEIRMERTVRSTEWLEVQHDSMRDALLEFGPIESWEGGA
jgi:hypothetical protein